MIPDHQFPHKPKREISKWVRFKEKEPLPSNLATWVESMNLQRNKRDYREKRKVWEKTSKVEGN